MFIKRAVHYFTGYVNIRVEGFYVERFINMCISKKIILINIKYDKATVMYTTVGVSDYRKLRQIAHKTHSKIRIEDKKGLPFKIHKYRKRKVFMILFIIIIGVMIISSNYIWNIDIIGNSAICYNDMINILEENGLKIGVSKNNLDVNEVIRKVRLNRDDIAWIGITIKGTNAIVKIKEADKAPNLIDSNAYCNIIADKYGLITKINVQNGTAEVHAGDIVEPREDIGQRPARREIHRYKTST